MRLRPLSAALTTIGCLTAAAAAQPAPPPAPGPPPDVRPQTPTTGTLNTAGVPLVLNVTNDEAKLEKGPYLGVSTSPATPVLRQQLQLPAGVGLVVDFVSDKSPAAAAGLKQYDVIQRFDDQLLVNQQQLAVLVRTHKPGDEVKLAVVRDGKPQTLTAKLAEHDLPPLEELRFGSGTLNLTVPAPAGEARAEIDAKVRDAARHAHDAEAAQREAMEKARRAFGQGGVAPGEPKWPDLVIRPGGPGGVLQHLSLMIDDGKTVLALTNKDGHRHLSAKDKAGNTLFDGPIDTPEQFEQVPPEIRAKLKGLPLFGGPAAGPKAKPKDGPGDKAPEKSPDKRSDREGESN